MKKTHTNVHTHTGKMNLKTNKSRTEVKKNFGNSLFEISKYRFHTITQSPTAQMFD